MVQRLQWAKLPCVGTNPRVAHACRSNASPKIGTTSWYHCSYVGCLVRVLGFDRLPSWGPEYSRTHPGFCVVDGSAIFSHRRACATAGNSLRTLFTVPPLTNKLLLSVIILFIPMPLGGCNGRLVRLGFGSNRAALPIEIRGVGRTPNCNTKRRTVSESIALR